MLGPAVAHSSTPTNQRPNARLYAAVGDKLVRCEIANDRFRIGRHRDNELRLNHRSVSRFHAEIIRYRGVFIIHDHRSTNGTWVGRRRVSARALKDGDVLHIGRVRFRFAVCPAGSVTAQHAPGTRDKASWHAHRPDTGVGVADDGPGGRTRGLGALGIGIVWGCLVAVIAALGPATPTVAASLFPPVRVWGLVGYNYLLDDFDDDEHVGLFRINAATFIVEPWIARVQGGIGLTLRDSDRQQNNALSGEIVTGDVLFSFFPRSHFPLDVFFVRTDDSTDAELLDRDIDTTLYGFEQRYRSKAGDTFLARFEHRDRSLFRARTDFESSTLEDETNNDFRLSYSRSLKQHFFEAELNWDDVDRETRRDNQQQTLTRGLDNLFTSLRHRYSSTRSTLTVTNQLLFRDTETDQELALGGQFNTVNKTTEFNNTTFWRPQTAKPLQVVGTMRLRDFSTTSDPGGRSVDSQTLTATVGANYQWRPRVDATLDASVNAIETEQRSDTSSFVRAGLDYTSRDIKLGTFDYQYFTGASVANRREPDETFQEFTLEAGHSLIRTSLFKDGWQLRARAQQSAAVVQDTEDRSTQNLLHTFSVDLSRRGPLSNALLLLSVNDSREFRTLDDGDEDTVYQSLRLQGSVDWRLNRFSTVRGNFTLQTQRTEFDTDRDITDLDEGFLPTATANISYEHQRVFGVPRLRFRSRLSFISDSYLPLLLEPEEDDDREDTIWDNRLEYNIGRLELALRANYTRRTDVDRTLILFEVRRFFGSI